MSDPYEELMDHTRGTASLSQIAGLLEWDREVMMPPAGGAQRAEQAAALEGVVHARRSDPRIADWLEAAEGRNDKRRAANLRLIRHRFERATRVPGRLAEELARTSARSADAWAKARAANDPAAFLPWLETIVRLRREEAQALAKGDGPDAAYDALLAGYEPGMETARLQPLLEGLRPRLSALRAAIADSGVEVPEFAGTFGGEAQLALARRVAERLGYDFAGGRLDLSVHPFSSGTGGDSRITTRLDAHDPMGCLYSTIHEIGHALYEQGVPRDTMGEPASEHVSMGVHESQSRIFENQIGRSRAFCRWLHPEMVAQIGETGMADADALYSAVNRVETGLIRVEADEVHYNLHVLLRFELERDLIGGQITASDIEEVWNSRFERDFGLKVPDAAHGFLQDVHWSLGLFGYFPTYALGNIYAAQLHATLRAEVPDLDAQLEQGDASAVLGFMRERIHLPASLDGAAETVERACGAPLSPEPLLEYLETKYAALYRL